MKSIYYLAFASLISCTAPRSVFESGKVTEKGHFQGGYNNSTNVSTAFGMEMYKGIKSIVTDYYNYDTIIADNQLSNLNKALISYSLDPLSNNSEMYLKYGFAKNFDASVKYAGALAIDAQYQFIGNGNDYYLDIGKNTNGSFGIQLSGKKYKFPSVIGDLQDFLGYNLNRKDVLLKFILSKELGKNEKIGHLGFGLVYNSSFIKYGFEPSKEIRITDENNNITVLNNFTERKNHYSSYGGFINFSVGYKYVYLTGGIAVYYQNYGTYYLYDNSQYNPKGITVIPSLGFKLKI